MKFEVIKIASKKLSLLDFMIFAILVSSEYSEHQLQEYSVATSCPHVMKLDRDTVQSSLVQDCAMYKACTLQLCTQHYHMCMYVH